MNNNTFYLFKEHDMNNYTYYKIIDNKVIYKYYVYKENDKAYARLLDYVIKTDYNKYDFNEYLSKLINKYYYVETKNALNVLKNYKNYIVFLNCIDCMRYGLGFKHLNYILVNEKQAKKIWKIAYKSMVYEA